MIDKVEIKNTTILSDNRYALKEVSFEYQMNDGTKETLRREVYERGNAAAVLLYNPATGTVILTKQFRLPSYLNGNKTGMLIEVCAGMLDEDSPEECAKREIEEETGYKVPHVEKVFDAYMSPGAVTEMIHFFTALYTKEMQVSKGGGLEEEQEYIEVLELPFNKVFQMIQEGEIKDAKTIMLLQHAKIMNLIS